MSEAPMPPAGWYANPEGAGLRWWDGERWTDHRQPTDPPAPAGSPFDPPTAQTVEGTDATTGDTVTVKPWQLLVGCLALLAVGGAVVALLAGDSKGESTTDSADATSQTAATNPVPASKVTPPAESLNGTDSVAVEFDLEEIHEACHGLQEIEIAEANRNQKKLNEGVVDASIYSGLVPGDVASLSSIYRQHPNAEYKGRALKEILAGTAEELQVGECNPTGAERLALAIADHG